MDGGAGSAAGYSIGRSAAQKSQIKNAIKKMMAATQPTAPARGGDCFFLPRIGLNFGMGANGGPFPAGGRPLRRIREAFGGCRRSNPG